MTVVRMYVRGICIGFSVKEAYGAPCMWGGGEEGGKTNFEDHMIVLHILWADPNSTSQPKPSQLMYRRVLNEMFKFK